MGLNVEIQILGNKLVSVSLEDWFNCWADIGIEKAGK
jgi:hypothetical protein